ncbi:hypothetical protein JD514_15125 [Aeromonas caviae]|uniref:hypothetical protein n=1 Tax=Aeromonas TaxID=642 RepID=UPI00191FC947|nr:MULTISPECIES: hypothetical protein [Aeromonas]MBL0498409.1 hypothetical protein [Aeromonas caviae]MBL0508255.1 hypothetical protein [Aeromonas caviae]MDX7762761.1 hypothetical protein [Aeromonas caviae]UJQ35118.1 hypothetical protein L1871_11985 [Aeromonas caviae]
MDKLTPYIDSKVAIGELELARIRREIKALPDADERALLNALALGAYQDVEGAKRAFEDAAHRYPSWVMFTNYKTYLKHIADYPKLDEVIYSLADIYESKGLVHHAVEHALWLNRDIEKYNHYFVKYMKYLNFEEQESESARFVPVLNDMTSCMQRVGIGSQELSHLSNVVHEVSALKKLSLLDNQISVQGGNLTMVISVENADPEVLCDANFELAMKMAEDELVFDKSMTAFFKASVNSTLGEQKG